MGSWLSLEGPCTALVPTITNGLLVRQVISAYVTVLAGYLSLVRVFINYNIITTYTLILLESRLLKAFSKCSTLIIIQEVSCTAYNTAGRNPPLSYLQETSCDNGGVSDWLRLHIQTHFSLRPVKLDRGHSCRKHTCNNQTIKENRTVGWIDLIVGLSISSKQ